LSPTTSITPVVDLVQDDLHRVEAFIQGVAAVEYPLLRELLGYVVQVSGKRVRPMITLLVGLMCGRSLDRFYPLAAAIEVLHTATLVHDDLVDHSSVRRGTPTLNTIVSQGATILVGDYLFANSAYLLTQAYNTRATAVFSKTLMIILDGELRQAFTAGDWQQEPDAYFAKIGAKTASLFSCAAETAAILSELPEGPIAALAAYGYNLGTAFQIVDDVLDFVGDEATLGKPVGSDLRQGNLTLPMMHYLRVAPEENPVRALFGGDADPSDDGHVALAIDAVRRSPAIDDALGEARRYADLAKAQVQALPENRYRQALLTLADYTATRVS
jgi:geranylgeranyl pyrophosphate synthase